MVCRGRQEGEADKTRGRRGAEMGVWFRKNKKNIKKTMVSVHRARYLLLFQDFRCVFSMMHASDLLTEAVKHTSSSMLQLGGWAMYLYHRPYSHGGHFTLKPCLRWEALVLG